MSAGLAVALAVTAYLAALGLLLAAMIWLAFQGRDPWQGHGR
ncbi:hypothetical protein [Caulobacter sp. FWC2]|nr:hypothetical protein [Caulobacter sp. FWC2]